MGGFNGQTLNTVECYNPTTNSWRNVAKMNWYRSGVGIGVMGGLLYAVGGYDGGNALKTVEAYNPDLDVWQPIANMTYCRRNLGERIEEECIRIKFLVMLFNATISCRRSVIRWIVVCSRR